MSTSGYSIDDGAAFKVMPHGGGDEAPFEVEAEVAVVVVPAGNDLDYACVIEGSRATLLAALEAAVREIRSLEDLPNDQVRGTTESDAS